LISMIRKASLVSLLIFATAAHAQVVLEDFSNTIRTGFTGFYGSWSSTGNTSTPSEVPIAGLTQGSGFFAIDSAAATNAATAKLEIFFAAPTDLTGMNQLTLAAQSLAGNAATSLRVFLFDANTAVASAAFDLSSFPTGSFTTVSQALTINSGASLAAVEGFVITGNIPGGSAAFRASFDSLVASVIPEPSTYAAIAGAVMLGFVAYRRRRQQLAAAA
jgi:hypothetical protein